MFTVQKKRVKRAINMLKIYFIIIREQKHICEKKCLDYSPILLLLLLYHKVRTSIY